MFQIDCKKAQSFLSDEEKESALKIARQSLQKVEDRSGKGSEWLGWLDILKHPDKDLLDNLVKTGAEIHNRADVFILCGIGGSYLGARAVIEALRDEFVSHKPDIVYAGHHLSGVYLEKLLNWLEEKKPDGKTKEVYLNVISKSGTTMETALAFRVLRDWIHRKYGEESASRIYCTTSKQGGALNEVIQRNGYKKYILPDDIGGRFSVLTPVGLLPIAAAGLDIQQLFSGAEQACRHFNGDPENLLEYVSTRLALYQKGFHIDLIASFEPSLASLGGWLQQLYGESEGKNGKGIFPALARYSTDLHSLGQMVQDGKRNIMETMLTVRNPAKTLRIRPDDDNLDGLNYLSGKSFEEINEMAQLGTTQAHHQGGVPVFTAFLDALDAASLGQAICYYELATAVFVYSLQENPFDQPGVEDYKKAMYRLLGKV